MKKADVLIIGAGPAGLFAIFELGMLGLSSAICDTLPHTGGQCSALYPQKPIYDVPAHPSILAKDLISNLEEQVKRFNPTYLLGKTAKSFLKNQDDFTIVFEDGDQIVAKRIIIASGGGNFTPNRPLLNGITEYENKSIFYTVKEKETFRDKNISIAGGGDSAVDWAIELSSIAKSVKIIHRRDKFKAADETLKQLQQLREQGKIDFIVPYQLSGLVGENGFLKQIQVSTLDGQQKLLDCEILLPFFGLAMDFGYLSSWGFLMDGKHISVLPDSMKTNIEGIYAIGDSCHYKGKLKLILNGFAEGAMAANSIKTDLSGGVESHFEYSTTIFSK